MENTDLAHGPARTFHARHGRLSQTRKDQIEQLLPVFGVDSTAQTDLRIVLETPQVFIDFGCGMGDHTRSLLSQNPDTGILAIDVHTAGISDLLKLAQETNSQKLRVYLGDGLELLSTALTPESIAEIHVLFPDPWPKARHHKRRLIRSDFLTACHQVLQPAGVLRIVSDIPDYLENAREVVGAGSRFVRLDENWPIPLTGYHRKAIREGRTAEALHYRKI